MDPNLVLVDNFEGWGTSLCWWANVVGGYGNRNAYASLAFTQLKLNIVRYNIGGGENPGIANTLEYRARMPGFEPSPGVWNWAADANQRWMLRQAVALGANRVVAFANSPPYWMTMSGSVTGSASGTSNNLQTGYESAFASYFATVVSNLSVLDGVTFESATPMNEPTGTWWKLGGRQEGCYMDASQQARLVNLLRTELSARSQPAGVVGSEDSDEQSMINSVTAYPAAARSNLVRLVTHTYGANNPIGVRNLAGSLRKPLWVSEYGDGDASGLTMGRRIRDDLAVMWARAWVYWQVVDNAGGWGFLNNPLDASGYTGFVINKKFYVMGQFSQFLRPGSQILSVGDTNSLAAYNATNRTLVIVTVNDSTNSFNVTYDLSAFHSLPGQLTRYRTSPSENLLLLSPLALVNRQLASPLLPQSVTTHVLTNVTPASPSSLPAAWYPFEGNSLDAAGHGNDGTPFGNVAFVPGKLGAQAAQFDGASSYTRIPCSVTNHFTISCWVKTTATAGGGQWWAGKGLVDGEVAGSVEDFGVALVGNKAAFGVGNPDTTITSTTAINDGLWHHVAATRDSVSGQMQLFVDGALQASAYGPLGPRAAPPGLRIGSLQTGASGGFLAGAIDDVQLLTRVFTAAEIGFLMNHAPAAEPVSDVAILAGRTLLVTNTATDPDLPAQTLQWSLLNPPWGAQVDGASGLLRWRPTVAQSETNSRMTVRVVDNGTPSLSATQSFTVAVLPPATPTLTQPGFARTAFQMTVTGDSGPDYSIYVATNLSQPDWSLLLATNPAVLPFQFSDWLATNFRQRFYRVLLGP